ncbi:hypothetical protein HN937_06920 [Candidatus Poribacteria bacterium]|nr:hypothetical protein [Candidatus Poribacteria bacterium]
MRNSQDGVALVHNGGVVEGPGWQQELKLGTALLAMRASGCVAMNVGVGEAALGFHAWPVSGTAAASLSAPGTCDGVESSSPKASGIGEKAEARWAL